MDQDRLAGIRNELKGLLVESLSLEEITPEKIADDEVLFVSGLGLDSLDAVEIVVLLRRNFEVDVVKDIEHIKEIFYSVDTLARYLYLKKFGESPA